MFPISLNELMNKQSSFLWYYIPWRSCDDFAMSYHVLCLVSIRSTYLVTVYLSSKCFDAILFLLQTSPGSYGNVATSTSQEICTQFMMTSSNGNVFSALLAFCTGNSPVTGEFPAQRPVTRSFYVFFDLRPNERLSKQWWGWWFETPLCPLWRQCNAALLSG